MTSEMDGVDIDENAKRAVRYQSISNLRHDADLPYSIPEVRPMSSEEGIEIYY